MKTLSKRFTAAVLLSILLMLAVPVSLALALTSEKLPSMAVDDASVGTVAWTDPGNITLRDNVPATASLGAGATSHYVWGSAYGFTLADHYQITGIEVTIKKKASSNAVVDNVVKLAKGGVLVGQNKANTSTSWLQNYSVDAVYGGPNDLWGTTWTPAEINDAGFGAVLAASNQAIASRTASVDSIQIKVYYGTATSTTVNCAPATVTYGGSTTCTAIVTALGGVTKPAGQVNWSTDGSGNFSSSSCTLVAGPPVTASCSVTYTPSAVGSGSHLITADYAGTSTFFVSSASDSVSVDKVGLTITGLAADDKVYDGSTAASLSGTAVLSGVINADDVTLAGTPSASFANKNVGDNKPVTVGGYTLSGADAGSYTLTQPTGLTANITQAPLTVQANNLSKRQGAADPALTYTVTSGTLFAGDSFTGALVREPGETPGNYAILQGTLSAGSNYDITFVPGIFRITGVMVFRSGAIADGFILESSETSSTGGTLNGTAATFSLGDDALNRQYRSILSFNTLGLPDNAVITKATLRIRRQGIVGTNPFTTHTNLLVDIRTGPFGAAALELADFKAASSLNNAAIVNKTALAGGWYSAPFKPAAWTMLNKTGLTQLRLRFQLDDNNDLGADLIRFYSGNYATAASRPVLVVEYTVP